MKKSRFTDEQIIGFLKQAESGMPVWNCAAVADSAMPRFQMASQVRWHGGIRRIKVAGLGIRERLTQEIAG